MAPRQKSTTPMHKTDTKEKIKKILSALFVALLSFALIFLFVFQDVFRMRGDSKDALASVNGQEIYRQNQSIQNVAKWLQENKKMDYNTALKYALNRYIQNKVLLIEGENAGINVDTSTLEMLLRSWAASRKMSLAQYVNEWSAQAQYENEKELGRDFIRSSVFRDVNSAFRITHLEMSMNGTLDRIKAAFDIALLDTTKISAVTDADLKALFNSEKTGIRAVYRPVAFTVTGAAAARTLASKLTPPDMQGIEAKTELHGVKLRSVRDLGWLLAPALQKELAVPMEALSQGGFSKPIRLRNVYVFLYLKGKSPVTDYASLGKDGQAALVDYYRQKNAGELQRKAVNMASARMKQLANLLKTGQPIAAAAKKLGMDSFSTALVSFDDEIKGLPRELQMNPEFKPTAFTLPKGGISGIIRSGQYLVIVKARDVRTTADPFAPLKDKNLPKKQKEALAKLYRQAIATGSRKFTQLASTDWLNSLYMKYKVRTIDSNVR